MLNKQFWCFLLSDKCTSGNSFGKEENKQGNLEPKGQAKINGVLTKREQLITAGRWRKTEGWWHPSRGTWSGFVRLMPKENVIMKQLVLSVCSECSVFDGMLCERRDSTQIWYISTTSENLFALHSGLLFFFCLILFCPPSCLRKEQVSIGRLVGGADVTVLWSPGFLNEAEQRRRQTDGILGGSLLLWRNMAH